MRRHATKNNLFLEYSTVVCGIVVIIVGKIPLRTMFSIGPD